MTRNGLTVFDDGSGCPHPLHQLDGTVGPGESRRGWMVFEVGDDATDLRLRLRGNLTATGAVFDLS